MVLEAYYNFLAQPCRALYVFIKSTGVQFENRPVELCKGKTEELI